MLILAETSVLEVLHKVCGGDLTVTTVEGRRSRDLVHSRHPDRLPDMIVGDPFDKDGVGVSKSR